MPRPKRIRATVCIRDRWAPRMLVLGCPSLDLRGSGYRAGDRVVIMTVAEAKELDRAWKALQDRASGSLQ